MFSPKSSTTPTQKVNHQDDVSEMLLNNRYTIQKIIGRGGIGITYLAFDTYQFNDKCVIKEFAPFQQKETQFKKLRDLFIREAKILYQLEHPQIPKFYACFEIEERLFIVQEYIEGQSYAQLLKQRLKQGKTFSESEIFSWLQNMLQVLDYIHQRGIIHRDISPDNIMQPKAGDFPMLIDFGVGKQCNYAIQNPNNNLGNKSHQYTLVGKIGYAAHEQLQFGECFPSSDLYSLGVSAIALLTGKKPNQLINSYLEWQWRNYTQIHDGFAQIIDKLLAYNPTKRYQSAQEVLVELNSLQRTVTELNNPNSMVSYQADRESINKPLKIQNVEATKLLDIVNTSHILTAEFIDNCQQELAYYIGPMATIIVEETLVDSSGLPKEKFIEALATNIPYWKNRREFYQKLVA